MATGEMTSAAVELLRKLERGGRLSAAQVVDAARDDASPIHGYFTWDDDKAAEAYRLDQARHLIARVRVVIESKDGGEAQRVTITSGQGTPVYAPDPLARAGYVSLERAKREPETAKALIAAEFAAAASYLARAEGIATALRGFKQPTARVRKEVERLRDRAAA